MTIKPIPGLPAYYADNQGQILTTWKKNRANGCQQEMRKVKLRIEKRTGYLCFTAFGKQRRVHVCVIRAFRGPSPDPVKKPHVRHSNGYHSDNRPSNLRWGSQKENCEDTVRHGRSTRGEKNPQAKLSRQTAIEIRERRQSGESGATLAKEYKISEATVCDIYKNRYWK